MRGATQAESSAQSAAVVMEREVALRRFGGTIRPTGPRKALTIPVNQRAYNRKAASFDGLFVVKFKEGHQQGGGKGSVFLARKGRKGALELMYLLTPKATIKPNAAVLPSDAALTEAVKEAATEYLKRRTAVRQLTQMDTNANWPPKNAENTKKRIFAPVRSLAAIQKLKL